MKTFRFTSCYHYICLEKFLALRCSLVREDMYFSTQKFDLVTQLLVFMEKPLDKRMSLSIYSIVATTPAHLDIFDKLCPVSMASLAASHCSAVSGFALLIFLTTPMQLFHD